MKLHNRQLVEDTLPAIYIGQRMHTDRHGETRISPIWQAECCHHGKEHFTTLNTQSRSVAIHRAHEFAERVRAAGEQMPTRKQIDVAGLARDYLTMQVNRGRAPKTIEKYEYVAATFVAWAQQNFNGSAGEFSEQHFWAWHKALIDDGFSVKTRSDRAIIIKQMFKWGARTKLIPTNPVADAILQEPPPTPQPCFEPWQVAKLLEEADDVLRPIFATMAYAGLRFGEVRDLTWASVVMPPDRPGFIIVQRGGSGQTTKSRKLRRVPLHAELRKILEALPRPGDRIFNSRPSKRYPDGGHAISESHVLLSLKRLCKRCGFDNPRQYKLHTFRHAFASMCARNNVAYKYALEWMGHKSSDILDLYYRQFDDVAEQAMKTIQYTPAGPPPTSPTPVTDAAVAVLPAVPYMRIAR